MAAPSDSVFWPPVAGILDLTLTFEHVIFSFVLSAGFLALSPFIFLYYSRQPVYIRQTTLFWVKLSAASLLVARQIASLAIWAVSARHYTDTTLPASAIDLVAAVAIAGTVHMEHRHSIRSSSLFSLFLLIGVLADATESRSLFLRPGLASLGGLAAASGASKLSLLVLQEFSKKSLLIDDALRRDVSSEATSGVFSRTVFLFLAPVFEAGFRGQLLMQHLGQLDPELAPELLYQQLKAHWHWQARPAGALPRSRILLKACFMAWKRQFLGLVVARLAVTGFNFAQPYIIQRVIDMVGTSRDGPADMQERGGLLGATMIVFFGLPIARAKSAHLMNRSITRLRGGLIALLFHKEHKLTETEGRKAAAATLMSADMDGIATGLPECLEIPIGAIELGFGIYMLSGFIGVSAFTVFVPLVVTTIASSLIGQRMAALYAKWNKKIEIRVAKTSRILSQLIAIKMLGLGPAVGEFLQGLRVDEIKSSKSYRRLEAVSAGPILLGDLLTPVVVIAAALFGSAFHGQMTAVKVFPTLAVVALIQRPLNAVLLSFPTISSMLACFSRIQDFLCLAERRDCRVTSSPDLPEYTGRDPSSNAGSLVRFNHADIASIGMTRPLLSDIDFGLAPGSITGLIGMTGSGKSAMVHSILGQSQVLGGSVAVATDHVAYCGQTVWLRDTSIRENVVGHLEYDGGRFATVMRACFLEEDLAWLPGGADYVVGPNGSNLSGGQRQRVGIARTAYAQGELTLLDDPFSSLDHDTAVCILHQLCGRNGLFRRAGCAVVFVTYLPQSLEVADQLIFVEDHSAKLTQRSDYGPYAERLFAALNSVSSSVPTAEENKEQRDLRASLEAIRPVPGSNGSDVRQRGDLRLYLLFINPIGRLSTILYSLFVSLFATGEIIPKVYIRMWIELDPDNSLFFIGYASVVVATCLVGCLVYWLLHTRLSPRSSIRLHEQLLQTTIKSTLWFFSKTKTGSLVNRYSQDMTLLSRNLPAAFLRTLYAGSNALINIGIVLSGATYLAGVLPGLLIALFYIQRYYLRTSRQVRHLDLEMKAPLYTFFEETASGLTHIQAFNWQAENIQRGLFLLAESQKSFYAMMIIQQWLALVLGFLTAVLGTLLVALALFTRQSSESAVGLSFMGILMLSYSLEGTIVAWTTLETSAGALARLATFMEETPQEMNQCHVELPSNWPAYGRVEFRNVYAHYARSTEVRPALRNVSLSAQPGQRIGIAGRSGSGKSTLFLTLLGFLEYDGVVEIDGINVSSISCEELRSRLVTVTQSQVRFDATIRTNLVPLTINQAKASIVSAPDADGDQEEASEEEKTVKKDLELEQLLKSLHIWAPLVDKGGLDSMLDDVGYSHGQIQLLCIARAIVKQRDTGCRVVLVDEATSSVDAATEKIVHKVMREYFAGCTVLTITHRRSGLDGVDAMIYLQRGLVVPAHGGRADSESSGEETQL